MSDEDVPQGQSDQPLPLSIWTNCTLIAVVLIRVSVAVRAPQPIERSSGTSEPNPSDTSLLTMAHLLIQWFSNFLML